MPVILEDEMLIPPSLRRKQYHGHGHAAHLEVSNSDALSHHSGSTIEIPRTNHQTVVHQDHYIPEVEIVREHEYIAPAHANAREYVVEPAGHNAHRRYYRNGGGRSVEMEYSSHSGRRARSVGPPVRSYEFYTSEYDDDGSTYYIDDGHDGIPRAHGAYDSGHGGHRQLHRHNGRKVATGAIGGAVAAHKLRKHHASRHASRNASRERVEHHNHVVEGDAHRGRHLIEGGLAGAAIGVGLEKLRNRSRRRSSRSRSSSRSSSHKLRNVAAAGLAAAGAKKLYDHQERRNAEHLHHEGWYDESHHEHHDPHHSRAKHLAEAGLGIAALAAAKELHDHRKSRSRSRSSSVGSRFSRRSHRSRPRSRSHSRSNTGAKIAGAALGASAVGLAIHKNRQHHARSTSVDSYSSSSTDGSHHRGRKVAGTLAGATVGGIAAKKLYERRHSRSHSTSSSSSDGGHSHRLRNAALGLGAAELARRHYSRSRSRSRPHGILKHHSRSRSRSRHSRRSISSDRSSHHSRKLMSGAAVTGMAHRRHHRSRAGSLDAEERRIRRREKWDRENRHHAHWYSDAPRRKGSGYGEKVGEVLRNAFSGTSYGPGDYGRQRIGPGGSRGSGGLGQAVAYRVGEAVADGLARRQDGYKR